jgi:hypothetical protein
MPDVASRRSADKPKYPRPASELPTRLSRELFAGAELVQLPAGQVLFRPAIPDKMVETTASSYSKAGSSRAGVREFSPVIRWQVIK